jgi:hypothetical protein
MIIKNPTELKDSTLKKIVLSGVGSFDAAM